MQFQTRTPTNRDAECVEFIQREMALPSTVDEGTRTIQVIAATENPVDEFDPVTRRHWPTVLLMTGPGPRLDDSIPFLLDHNVRDSRQRIGSLRNPRVEVIDGLASLVFDGTVSASEEAVWTKIREGHLSRVSVGRLDYSFSRSEYAPFEYVEAGQRKVVAGREFVGPVRIVTDWTPKETSLVTFPRDHHSRVRSTSHDSGGTETSSMPPEVYEFLVSRGMSPTATQEEAEAFAASLRVQPPKDAANRAAGDTEEDDDTEDEGGGDQNRAASDVEQALIAERSRSAEIMAACQMRGIGIEQANAIIGRGLSLVDSLTELTRLQGSRTPVNNRVSAGEQVADRMFPEFVTGMALRCGYEPPANQQVSEVALRSSRRTLVENARELLRWHGQMVDHHSDLDVIMMANRMDANPFYLNRDGAGYNRPTTLPQLLLEVGNRMLLQSFEQAPYRWREWVHVMPPVNDFRPVDLLQVDEGSDFEEIMDDEAPPEDRVSNTKETVRVTQFGRSLTLSFRAQVNDDLGFWQDRINALANNSSRTINRQCVKELASNPTLGQDGVALFHASHGNLITAGGVPSVAELGKVREKLRLQAGINSSAILNFDLGHILIPAALETTAEQVVQSVSDVAKTNSNSSNPFYKRAVIADPMLDAENATKWYGFAPKTQSRPCVIMFLRGYETPRIQRMETVTAGQQMLVHQSWSRPKFVTYRGIVQNDGDA